MSQIGIKVTADAESIQTYCHNVEGMLKTIYNDQLRKVKAINILKRIEKVVNIIGLLLATFDVMKMFADIYGEWSEYYGCNKWQTLTKCATYYCYDWGSETAHDSLADCKATLYCYKKIQEQKMK